MVALYGCAQNLFGRLPNACMSSIPLIAWKPKTSQAEGDSVWIRTGSEGCFFFVFLGGGWGGGRIRDGLSLCLMKTGTVKQHADGVPTPKLCIDHVSCVWSLKLM